MSVQEWEKRASQARKQRDKLIPSEWLLSSIELDNRNKCNDVRKIAQSSGILTELDKEITDIADASQLLLRIASGQYSSQAVMTAYCKTASIANQLTNCLTEVFFESAIERAKELDRFYADNGGKTVGPLHGLPVSFKDNFSINGVQTTVGIVSWIGNIVHEDAVIVDALKSAGAIPFVKTNVPPAMSLMETENNLYGRTVNAFNTSLTASGSSGGEASLLALKGSIVGIGTDIGASVRVPSAFQGLYCIKPSVGRLPSLGVQSPNRGGVESIVSVPGIMTRSLSSLELVLSVLTSLEAWKLDPKVIPMPWNANPLPALEKAKLTVGFLFTDNILKPTPPIQRALNILWDKLKSAGHEVIKIDVGDLHRDGVTIAHKMFLQEGGKGARGALLESGEPQYERLFCGSEATILSAQEVYANHIARNKVCLDYLRLWEKTATESTTGRLDVLITPVAAHPANPHGKWISNSYTAIFSLLDYPATVIPVTQVDMKLDRPTGEWKARIPYEKIDTKAPEYGDAELKILYDKPETFSMAPIGLQIVGKRLQEEKLLEVTQIIDEIIHN